MARLTALFLMFGNHHMAKNTIKSKAASGEATKQKQRSSPKGKSGKTTRGLRLPSMPEWLTDERFRKIFGVFLIILAVFLLLSGVSFLMTAKNDLVLILNDPELASDGMVETYRNLLGRMGAHAGYLMMYRGFGIAGLFIPFLLFLIGTRIAFRKKLLPFGKSIRLSLLAMLIIPLLIGFLFHDKQEVQQQIEITCNDNLVGLMGQYLTRWSVFTLGGVGTFLLLLLVIGSTVIFNFNPPLDNLNLPPALRNLLSRPVASAADQTEAPEEEASPRNRQKHEETTLTAPSIEEDTEEHRTNSALDELIGSATADLTDTADNEEAPQPELEEDQVTALELDPEVVDDTLDDYAAEAADANTPGENEEEDDLEIEVSAEETELTEDEIDERVQEFGAYDPKLDLARYELPNIDLLEAHGSGQVKVDKQELEENKNRIVETLQNYKIDISKIKATVGPTITLYEIIPAPGVRISKIKNLEDDIALSLAALGIRIIAPIPGKGTIGIEVPNSDPSVVSMRSLIASDKFQGSDMQLPIAIGKTISNETFMFDLAKMPHLLMAGATGQGKSVGLNAMLVSLLYKKHPSQLKFVLVDPKKVELTLFNKIERHYLAKLPGEEEAIITDTQKVVTTLNSLCVEMDQRYELLKIAQCRNIKEYNGKFVKRKLNPENGHRYLPYIVLVVDEFADLIMTAGKEVETPIARLAQLARAIGIHLIIATQRPSVNIITGVIKANFPARIAFRVTSKIDSRTILDAGGADQLIGRGDMLFSTGSDLIRIQCGFVDTPEVEQITEFIGNQQGYPDAMLLPEYVDENASEAGGLDAEDRDELFEEAARVIVMHQQGSTSLLQRKLKLGYNRAGRLIDQLEAAGVIGPFKGSKAREVLIADEMSLEQLLRSEG